MKKAVAYLKNKNGREKKGKVISKRNRKNEEVVVYTNITGNTVSVESNDERAEVITMSNLMLQDIIAAESGYCGDTLLTSLDGLRNGLYSSAFSYMLYLVNSSNYSGHRLNDHDLPQTVNTAVKSLSDNERGLKASCEKLEKSGIYPGSPVYMKLLHTKYYVESWNKQLRMLVSIATEFPARDAVASGNM